MKLLLINSKVSNIKFFPLGLGYIASVLQKDGHEVEVLDINGYGYSNQAVIERLNSYKDVDVVGISGHIVTYMYQRWLISEAKRAIPHAVVISGGGLASTCSDILFRETGVDIVVIGEGEITVAELVRALADGTSLEKVDGIKYRDGDHVKTTRPRALIKDLDSIPNPARGLFSMDIYSANHSFGKKFITGEIFSSRGCPFNCNYCYHIFGRRSARFRSAESVIEEVTYLKKQYGINHVAFADDNLTANKKRLYKICEAIKELNLSWWCNGRVDSSDLESLRIMKEAGCNHVNYGMESGSQEMLDNMNKSTSVERARRAIKMHKDVGLEFAATFMLGTPGETRETIKKTIDFIIENDVCEKIFFITPYPMTPLWEIAKQRKLITDDEKFIRLLDSLPDSRPIVNFTELSDDELIQIKQKAERDIAWARYRRHPLRLVREILMVPAKLLKKVAS